MQNKKILVTGGAGFIGSDTCDALLKNINRVMPIKKTFKLYLTLISLI